MNHSVVKDMIIVRPHHPVIRPHHDREEQLFLLKQFNSIQRQLNRPTLADGEGEQKQNPRQQVQAQFGLD